MCMSMNSEEARVALFDYFVDFLVEIYAPEEDEAMDVRSDMMTLVEELFADISLEAIALDENLVTFSAHL